MAFLRGTVAQSLARTLVEVAGDVGGYAVAEVARLKAQPRSWVMAPPGKPAYRTHES